MERIQTILAAVEPAAGVGRLVTPHEYFVFRRRTPSYVKQTAIAIDQPLVAVAFQYLQRYRNGRLFGAAALDLVLLHQANAQAGRELGRVLGIGQQAVAQ